MKFYKNFYMIIKSSRPSQWKKNLLVYAAAFASGSFLEVSVFVKSTVAFVIFILISSTVYLINDVFDSEFDSAHPTKKNRPIASNQLSKRLAVISSIILAVIAISSSFLFLSNNFGFIVIIYLFLQVTYIYILKDKVVLDLISIASGFVLRAIAGAIATSILASPYFIVVIGFSSLFVISGKRFSEIKNHQNHLLTRPALAGYSLNFLRLVWSISLSISIVFYIMWAMELSVVENNLFPSYSVFPFIIALLRYASTVDSGGGEFPEKMLSADIVLVLCAVTWGILLMLRFA
jgi:decaprenyl-phosphate phosphoribosyltransferase